MQLVARSPSFFKKLSGSKAVRILSPRHISKCVSLVIFSLISFKTNLSMSGAENMLIGSIFRKKRVIFMTCGRFSFDVMMRWFDGNMSAISTQSKMSSELSFM